MIPAIMFRGESFRPLGIKTHAPLPEGFEATPVDFLLSPYFQHEIDKIPGSYDDVQQALRIDAYQFIPDDFTYDFYPKKWNLLHARGFPSSPNHSLTTVFLGRDSEDADTTDPMNASAAIVYKRTVDSDTGLVVPSTIQISWIQEGLIKDALQTVTYDAISGEAIHLGVTVHPALLPHPSEHDNIHDHYAYIHTSVHSGTFEEASGVITDRMTDAAGDPPLRMIRASRREADQFTFDHSEGSTYFAQQGFAVKRGRPSYVITRSSLGNVYDFASFPASLASAA